MQCSGSDVGLWRERVQVLNPTLPVTTGTSYPISLSFPFLIFKMGVTVSTTRIFET